VKTIYVLSDGFPNNESSVMDWITIHPKVTINTTSFEANGSARTFLDQMARRTQGTFRVFNSDNLKY